MATTKSTSSTKATAQKTTSTKAANPSTSAGDGYAGEAEAAVQIALNRGRIRFQKIRQSEETLRGEKAKTERVIFWADTQELRRDIQQEIKTQTGDRLTAEKANTVLNRASLAQQLAAKSYKVQNLQQANKGQRQILLNEGVSQAVDFGAGLGNVAKTVEVVETK